jgi:hypothetical protein
MVTALSPCPWLRLFGWQARCTLPRLSASPRLQTPLFMVVASVLIFHAAAYSSSWRV